jgi:hypothetical protein
MKNLQKNKIEKPLEPYWRYFSERSNYYSKNNVARPDNMNKVI